MLSHMEPDQVATAEVVEDAEVMSSVDDGPTKRYIIADVSRDDAFLTVHYDDAASLPAWR
jgi:hypothetical protein